MDIFNKIIDPLPFPIIILLGILFAYTWMLKQYYNVDYGSIFKKKIFIIPAISLFTIIIIYLSFFMISVYTNKNDNPRLMIKYPKHNMIVNSKINIYGKCKYINNTDSLYVLVYNIDRKKYYPEENKIDLKKNSWWYNNLSIGSSADIGKKFKIIIIKAEPLGANKLDKYFSISERRGLYERPSGKILDSLTVKRNNLKEVLK